MRFRIVTVAILLAIASRGYGRPRDPDPLDNSSQEATRTALEAVYTNSSPDSRYMMTMTKQTASPSFKSNRRRDISINNFKYRNSSNNLGWIGRSIFPSLNFGNGKKNFLPLGALSIDSQNDINIRPISLNRQSIAKRMDNFKPLIIPIISSHISIPIPIPVSITPKNKIITSNFTHREDKKLLSLIRINTPKPIPLSSSPNLKNISNMTFREERKLGSRTLVRIVPQSIKPGYNVRRNSTRFKVKPQLSSMQFKNWPNEVLQNVQDLFNYEKYTTFTDNEKHNNKLTVDSIKPPNREPSIKSPESMSPVKWSKIPVVEVTTSANDRIDVDTTMKIDNLLDDLGSNKIQSIPQTFSEVAQNTVVHILNAGSRKPNVTIVKPVTVVNKINRTKTDSIRPPQNVHIMFMMNKDESNSTVPQKPPKEILGNDTDCPTIMINSLTQINNSIESKEGCTDLNIVINSHVLNTHIFKPSPTVPNYLLNSTEASKDPYSSSPENSNDQSNYENNNYQNNNVYKEPNIQSSEPEISQPIEPTSGVSIFEVFQGTHINIGGGSSSSDIGGDIEENSAGISGFEDLTSTSSTEEATDVDGTNTEEPIYNNVIGSTNTGGPPVEEVQSSISASAPSEVGSGQANDASAAISLPSIPNIPNLPNVANQLTNLPSSAGSGGSGGAEQTDVITATDEDDDDEDDLEEALSPVELLESITSVFTYVSDLNPINYGIFGMTVAPFVAFAAGIVGVAAFLFPWAFPSSLELGRKWDEPNYGLKYSYYPNIQKVVHSSINKYRHLNEWKGRRRKKKRRR